MQRFPTLLLVVALPLAVGCSSYNQVPVSKPPADVWDVLQEVSLEARREIRSVARLMDAKRSEGALDERSPSQRFFEATYVPPGFERTVDFRFVGDAVRAARAVAEVAGYRFEPPRKELPNPVWVNIQISARPLNEVLRELGAQMGRAARIELYPPARLLRVTYPTKPLNDPVQQETTL